MRDDLAELLITHYVGGAWVAPLGSRNLRFGDASAGLAGTLVAAGRADIDRAVAAAQGAVAALAAVPDRRARLAAAAAPLAVELPGLDGVLARAPESAGGPVPTAMIGGPALSPARMASVLFQLLMAGCPLVLNPCVTAPLPALRLALALHGAGLPPGSVNLIHGDAATARALAAHPGIGRVWQAGQASGGIRPSPRR